MANRVLSVVGTRPQLVKSVMVSRALMLAGIEETLVHTNQHYSQELSQIFLDEFSIHPHYNLDIGAASPVQQTAAVMSKLETILLREKPDIVLVYGDCSTTLAAALCAMKLRLPVAHVEAGPRQFDMRIPEEANRKLTDHVSALLFCPSSSSVQNLRDEGIEATALYFTGDVLFDLFQKYYPSAHSTDEKVILLTLHRPMNTDNFDRLSKILHHVNRLTEDNHVLFPIHPRTADAYQKAHAILPGDINYQPPLSYLETLEALKSAFLVITDSGGLQKEAYFARVPCLVMDKPAVWPEIEKAGWQRLCTPENVYELAREELVMEQSELPDDHEPGLFGNGHAAERIAEILKGYKG